MARARPTTVNLPVRLTEYDLNSHRLLAPTSKGTKLSAGMRLVALVLLLWDEENDPKRVSMTPDFIADRTSIPLEKLPPIMDNLEAIGLVQMYADGWRLTMDHFNRTTGKLWTDRKPTA